MELTEIEVVEFRIKIVVESLLFPEGIIEIGNKKEFEDIENLMPTILKIRHFESIREVKFDKKLGITYFSFFEYKEEVLNLDYLSFEYKCYIDFIDVCDFLINGNLPLKSSCANLSTNNKVIEIEGVIPRFKDPNTIELFRSKKGKIKEKTIANIKVLYRESYC